MPKIVNSPTERTTAVTDALLSTLALPGALHFLQIGNIHPWKATLWAVAFGFLALAAAIGAVAHGINIANKVKITLWSGLYLSLGLVVALFAVGTIYDLWGLAAAQTTLPVMMVAGTGFLVVIAFWPKSYMVFTIYQGIVMIFSLTGYMWLALNGQLRGAWWMVAGILVTLVAAAVQTRKRLRFTAIWKFDHNGAYHLIQMVGIALLVIGLHQALLSG